MLYRFDKVQGLDPYYYSFNPCHPFSQGDCVDTAVSSRLTLTVRQSQRGFVTDNMFLYLLLFTCNFFVCVLFPVVLSSPSPLWRLKCVVPWFFGERQWFSTSVFSPLGFLSGLSPPWFLAPASCPGSTGGLFSGDPFFFFFFFFKCCLMSSDVGWHIRDKLRPMREHVSILLYVHGNHEAR